MILLCDLIDVGDQVLILKEQSPKLFIVISILVKVWWLVGALNLLHILVGNFVR